jgi:hypothetical protein
MRIRVVIALIAGLAVFTGMLQLKAQSPTFPEVQVSVWMQTSH